MLVLAVDTSTPVVTSGVISVLRPHEIVDEAGRAGATAPRPVRMLAEATHTDAFGHAEYLMPLVRDALHQAGATLTDLEAIVVGLGPGPFTGLRVGIATASALGDALSLPVHGVPSHDGVALAVGPPPTGRPSSSAGDPSADSTAGFLVATDARRREVYLSAYRGGTRRGGPLVAAPVDVAAQLPADLRAAWVVGAGADLVAPVLGLPVRAIDGSVAEGLVRAALRPLSTGPVPGPLSPLYLRRPDATVPGAPKPVLPTEAPSGTPQ